MRRINSYVCKKCNSGEKCILQKHLRKFRRTVTVSFYLHFSCQGLTGLSRFIPSESRYCVRRRENASSRNGDIFASLLTLIKGFPSGLLNNDRGEFY